MNLTRVFTFRLPKRQSSQTKKQQSKYTNTQSCLVQNSSSSSTTRTNWTQTTALVCLTQSCEQLQSFWVHIASSLLSLSRAILKIGEGWITSWEILEFLRVTIMCAQIQIMKLWASCMFLGFKSERISLMTCSMRKTGWLKRRGITLQTSIWTSRRSGASR